MQNRRYFRFGLLTIITLIIAVGIALMIPRSAKDTSAPMTVAIAVPQSGSDAAGGEEIVRSVQLYFDRINSAGGVNGHPLQLISYDDQATAQTAKQVAQKIVDSSALLVLGHRGSDASLAAGEIYQNSRIAAITGTANNDRVTTDRPYYFRTIYTNATLNRVLALYAQQVLGFQNAYILFDKTSVNERAQAKDLQNIFGINGNVKALLPLDTTAENRTSSLKKIIQTLIQDREPSIIVLTSSKADIAKDVLVTLRKGGITNPVLADQALGRESFAKLFQDYSEEERNPGFFTNGLYVVSPILFDSAGADAQDFFTSYQKVYGTAPSYLGAKFYEAAIMGVEGLKRADLQLTSSSLAEDREKIRQALSRINSRKNALNGLSGPLYFNANQSSDLPARVAQFQEFRLISAPQQFTPILNLDPVDLSKEVAAGHIAQAGDQYFWKQRVVYTGIDINRLNRIEQNRSSYNIDFYLWFRYTGNDEPVNIQFPEAILNSTNPNAPIYDPLKPIKSEILQGLNYRLYQVRGDFRNAFDFRDYPFDLQKLLLRFDNPRLSSDRLIYVIDTIGLRLPKSEAAQRRPFQGLQLWKFKEMSYAQDVSRSTSTQGDPKLFATNTQIDYPGFSIRMLLQRRTGVFLSKNLLPLFLLATVTYCALYFPYSMFVPRTMAPASALLSGIVLLLAFNNQLPEVGYTVAIEYIFYTYFLLCLIPIIVTVIGSKFDRMGHKNAVKYLDIGARLLFPLIILGVVMTYWLQYGSRLLG